ncbi:MAG TPA: GGDEF domain-containing protein, partial [Tabrizicola sp.]|nr:GGDEF domain-containing protein [Tabrizicola sp.]
MMFAILKASDRPWQLVALLPVLAVIAYRAVGELGLVALAASLPIAVLVHRLRCKRASTLAMSDQVIERLDLVLSETQAKGGATGCLVIQFDDPGQLADRLGRSRQCEVLASCIARLRGALRPGDMLFPMEDGSLAVALAATPRLDAEIMVRIAARLHLVVQQPLELSDGPTQVTCSIGFCHDRQLRKASGRA